MSFLTGNTVRPHHPSSYAKICGRDSLSPPDTHFFPNLPFQNLRLKVVPPAERGADTVSILLIYARIMKKCLSNCIYDNLRSFIIVDMAKNPFFLQVQKIERINRD